MSDGDSRLLVIRLRTPSLWNCQSYWKDCTMEILHRLARCNEISYAAITHFPDLLKTWCLWEKASWSGFLWHPNKMDKKGQVQKVIGTVEHLKAKYIHLTLCSAVFHNHESHIKMNFFRLFIYSVRTVQTRPVAVQISYWCITEQYHKSVESSIMKPVSSSSYVFSSWNMLILWALNLRFPLEI